MGVIGSNLKMGIHVKVGFPVKVTFGYIWKRLGAKSFSRFDTKLDPYP